MATLHSLALRRMTTWEALRAPPNFFTFSPTAALWLEGPKLTASDGAEGDRFGARVGFDGSSAMGGAQFSDQGANQTGSAYIFTGLVAIDCNMNGTNDACDIVDGSSEDSNDNGVPDECECPWDLNDNGSVGAADLLALLVSWGPCKGCPADFDGDGSVGASDLLTLLVNWGPCP